MLLKIGWCRHPSTIEENKNTSDLLEEEVVLSNSICEEYENSLKMREPPSSPL